jgi:hypothetical protein
MDEQKLNLLSTVSPLNANILNVVQLISFLVRKKEKLVRYWRIIGFAFSELPEGGPHMLNTTVVYFSVHTRLVPGSHHLIHISVLN